LSDYEAAADVAEDCADEEVAVGKQPVKFKALVMVKSLTQHGDPFQRFCSVICGPTSRRQPERG
jgi:hypothetical protein